MANVVVTVAAMISVAMEFQRGKLSPLSAVPTYDTTERSWYIVTSEYSCVMIINELLTQMYGSRNACLFLQHAAVSFIINGTQIAFGKSYCLPRELFSHERASEGVGDHVSGKLKISYDVKQARHVSKCGCKWVDFFGGLERLTKAFNRFILGALNSGHNSSTMQSRLW